MPTTTCPQCGAQVDAGAAFCSRCGGALSGGATFGPPPGADPTAGGGDQGWGAPPPGPGPAFGPPPAGAGQTDDRNVALLAHLSALVAFIGIPSFLGPLVVWLVKRDQSPYVAAHAVEALNFNLSVLIYVAVGFAVGAVGTLVTFGIAMFALAPLGIVAAIGWFVVVILASMSASRGEFYRYPLTIRLVR